VTSVDIFSLARHGHLAHLKQLLEHGVDPNSKDKNGNTILIIAAQNGNKAMVKLALSHGALINMTNMCGNSSLHFAIEFQYHKVSSYLIRKGANQEITNIRGYRAKEGIRARRNPLDIKEKEEDILKQL